MTSVWMENESGALRLTFERSFWNCFFSSILRLHVNRCHQIHTHTSIAWLCLRFIILPFTTISYHSVSPCSLCDAQENRKRISFTIKSTWHMQRTLDWLRRLWWSPKISHNFVRFIFDYTHKSRMAYANGREEGSRKTISKSQRQII